MLVPLFRDDTGELRLVLVARSPLGLHGGQLGLPGGRREPADGSLLETALRETEEEIGLERPAIEVLAEVEPFDSRTTGFRVSPFVARVRPPKRWAPTSDEITAVLTAPVETLADEQTRTHTTLAFPNWPAPREVECVALPDGYLLWGLTLRMLDAVLPRVLAGEWQIR